MKQRQSPIHFCDIFEVDRIIHNKKKNSYFEPGYLLACLALSTNTETETALQL